MIPEHRHLMKLSRPYINQIVKLLEKDHIRSVHVGTSQLEGAGQGVFASSKIHYGTILCFYAGIYTPSLPLHSSVEDIFLANITSPSGSLMDENAYILNLQQPFGGFIDGDALEVSYRMDENPSACGHLINHSSQHANMDVINFRWDVVLSGMAPGNEHAFYRLPNVARCDGSAWYFDSLMNKVVYFDDVQNSRNESSLSGSVIYATRELNPGDELLLNYRLKFPYPKWAKHWYS